MSDNDLSAKKFLKHDEEKIKQE